MKIPVTVKISAETLQELIKAVKECQLGTEKPAKTSLDEIVEQCIRKFLNGQIAVET